MIRKSKVKVWKALLGLNYVPPNLPGSCQSEQIEDLSINLGRLVGNLRPSATAAIV